MFQNHKLYPVTILYFDISNLDHDVMKGIN